MCLAPKTTHNSLNICNSLVDCPKSTREYLLGNNRLFPEVRQLRGKSDTIPSETLFLIRNDRRHSDNRDIDISGLYPFSSFMDRLRPKLSIDCQSMQPLPIYHSANGHVPHRP